MQPVKVGLVVLLLELKLSPMYAGLATGQAAVVVDVDAVGGGALLRLVRSTILSRTKIQLSVSLFVSWVVACPGTGKRKEQRGEKLAGTNAEVRERPGKVLLPHNGEGPLDR